jgi:hypothetical protein
MPPNSSVDISLSEEARGRVESWFGFARTWKKKGGGRRGRSGKNGGQSDPKGMGKQYECTGRERSILLYFNVLLMRLLLIFDGFCVNKNFIALVT